MARQRVREDKLVAALADVFRAQGYEGASLARLSKATGLEKASLYHRFPAGKEDMAAAVVASVSQWFQDHVFTTLEGPGMPSARVRQVAARLREFYAGGTKSCAINTLSLPGGAPALHEAVRASLNAWLRAFARIARESGASSTKARACAEQAIIEVQGALVLSRVLGDCKPFRRVLDRLPDLLTRHRG